MIFTTKYNKPQFEMIFKNCIFKYANETQST